MDEFGCMLPSYGKDLSRAKSLVTSFETFCMDDTKLYIVVPDSEISQFSQLESNKVFILGESSIPIEYAKEGLHGARQGYINQELIKLGFWKTGILENYLCLDSDGEFIRPFSKQDFMYSENEPFTVMFDDKELMCQPEYRSMWDAREVFIRKIYETYEISQPRFIRTCHGFQIFSRDVLLHMEREFLGPRGWNYLDLMRISPYEFSWYTLYLVKIGVNIRQTEHFFKLYHNASLYLADVILGIGREELSHAYVGVIVNSNFQPSNKQIDFSSSKVNVIASYLKPSELISALVSKVRFIPIKIKIFIYNSFIARLRSAK